MEPTHFESLYPANTREEEIAKILAFIKEGASCQVISLPGGGRSNLLGLLSYNRNVRLKHLGDNQKWFHFVLSNFAEVRKRSLFETTKFLFLSLIASLRERGMEEEHRKTSTIFKKSLSFNDEMVLFQGLKRTIDLLSIEKELTVVFLFDRFEDYIPTVTPEFFTNLRVLRDRAKYRFSVVFSIPKPLEDTIGEDILSDFYQFVAGHIAYLPLLDKPGLEFRTAYMEKASGKKLEKEIIDAIIGLFSNFSLIGKTEEFIIESFGTVVAGIIEILALLIITIALLYSLIRLWFVLIIAYITILIDVVLAPFWIIAGLLPGVPLGFGAWARSIISSLAAFPATLIMFLLAKAFVDGFGTKPSETDFIAPFIGAIPGTDMLGNLIALGFILMTPNVVNMVRAALKAPSMPAGGSIGTAIGVGGGVLTGPLGIIRQGGLALYAGPWAGRALFERGKRPQVPTPGPGATQAP